MDKSKLPKDKLYLKYVCFAFLAAGGFTLSYFSFKNIIGWVLTGIGVLFALICLSLMK